MKVFISQKMRGLTHEQILEERTKIQATFIKHIGGVKKGCEFIKSYIPELKFKDPITSLSQSLALLAEADVVLVPISATMVDDDVPPRTMIHGTNPLRGCEFEYLIAKSYGKNIVVYDSQYVYF